MDCIRNCEYPQELVLRLLDGACHLTQVQLLSHQTHIATKIELFLSTSASLHDATFHRLGCVVYRLEPVLRGKPPLELTWNNCTNHLKPPAS